MTEDQRKALFDCFGCGVNTHVIGEYYMLFDSVWKNAVEPKNLHKMLCIGCLESRLGRRLCSADFIDALINDPDFGQSERLRDRLRADKKKPAKAGFRA